MAQLTVYIKYGSCALVPHCLLSHLAIPYQKVTLQYNADGLLEAADGSFTHDGFLKVNAKGRVPVVDVGGQIITEMPAILTYLSTLAPNQVANKLQGSTPLEHAQVLQWMAWLSGDLHSIGYGMLWRPTRFTDDETALEGVQQKAREKISQCYITIEQHLSDKEYMVGNTMTLVDFNLYVFWRWGERIQMPMATCYPNYRHLMSKMEALEGVRLAMQEEGLQLSTQPEL